MSLAAVLRRCDSTGRFVAPGLPTLGLPPAFGQYAPLAAVFVGAMATGTNTGLTGPGNLLADKPTPSGGLTPDNATTNLGLTSPTVIENVWFKSRDVFARSAGIEFRNCRFGGGSSTQNTGMINATGMPVGGDLRITDCSFVKTTPSTWYQAVLGHDFTATRCHVGDTVDAFNVYNVSTPSGPLNVNLFGNWVDALSYISPDPNQADGHTHNDWLQIQGGSKVRVVGNAIRALASTSSTISSTTTSPYAPSVSGSGVAVTCSVGNVSDVTIDRNLFLGASQPITVISQKGNVATNLLVTGNVFDLRSTPALTKTNDIDSTARRRAVLADPTATFLDAAGNNVWTPAIGLKSIADAVNGNTQINADGSVSLLTVYRFKDG